MALKIYEKFAPRANIGDTNYPNGSIVNASAPGVKDGTPLDADWGNDYAGFDAALFAEVGITPNGDPDTALSSQRLEAIKLLGGGSGGEVFETVDDMLNATVNWASISSASTAFNNSISKAGGANYRINTLEQERINRDDPAWVPDGAISSPITYKGTTYLGGVTVGADHYLGGGTEYVAILDLTGGQPWDAQFGTIGATVGGELYNDTEALLSLISYCATNRNKADIGGLRPYISPQSVFYFNQTIDTIDFRVDLNWNGSTLRPITPITSVNYESVGAEFSNLYVRHSHLSREDIYNAKKAAITLSGGQPISVNSESVFNTMSRVLIYDAWRGVELDSTGTSGGLIWQFTFDEVTAWHSLDYGFYFDSLNQVSTTTSFRSCHTKNVDGDFVQHNGVVYYSIQHMEASSPVEPGVTTGWEDYWRVKEVSNGVPATPSTEPQWVTNTFYRTNGNGYFVNNIQTCALYNCSADGSNNWESGSIIYSLNSVITIDTFHLEGVRIVRPDSPFFDLNSDVNFGSLYLYDLQINLPDAADRSPLIGGTLNRARVMSLGNIRNHTQNAVRKGQFDVLRCTSGAGIDFNAVSTGVGVNPELVTGTSGIAYFWTDQTVIDYRKPDVEFVMPDPASHYKIYSVTIPDIDEPTPTYVEFNDHLDISVNSGNESSGLGASASLRVSSFVQSGVAPNKSYFDVEQLSGTGDLIYTTFNTTTRLLEIFVKCNAAGQSAMIKIHGRNSGFGGGETPYKDGSTSRLLSAPEAVADATVEAMEGYDSAPLGRQAIKLVVSPHTLTNGDSGYWLYFDSAADGNVIIPNGLHKGTSALVTNLGTGNITYSIDAGEVGRGATTLSDPDAFMSLTKLTSTIWQCSERA